MPDLTIEEYGEMPELLPWREEDPAPAPAPALRRTHRTSPRAGCRHETRPVSAITIESHDNVEYVSLFDYGARPMSVAVMPPPPPPTVPLTVQPPPDHGARRRVAERTVSEPCRRVARRLTKLHHSGQAELRQIVGGLRSKSMRLSRNFDDAGRGATQPEQLRRGGSTDMSGQKVCEEVPKLAAGGLRETVPKVASGPGRRSTWYCELRDPVESAERVQQDEQYHQQQLQQQRQEQQQQQQQRQKRPQLRSFGSFRVLMRRSGGADSDGRRRWRPLSQFFDTSKSRQRPPFASEVHAVSLQRLPTSDEQWRRAGVSSGGQGPSLAAHDVMSVTSLPTAESHKYLPAPLDGGVRRLRQKLAGLVHGTPRDPPAPAVVDLLGARLASSQLLESPLLTCQRRSPLVCSMTSLASSQSSASDSGTETEGCGSGGFYEMEMDILEHIGVEVCF